MEGLIPMTSESDPLRCQGLTPVGQCRFQRIEESTFCKIHAGRGNSNSTNQKLRNYRLQKWESRVSEFADSTGVKSLRDEIGILRIILEEMVTKCSDATDLLLYSPRITDLVLKVEKVVVSCHKLETQTGMLLDKSTALVIAGQIVEIVSEFVKDPNDVDKIASRIATAILGAKADDPKTS